MKCSVSSPRAGGARALALFTLTFILGAQCAQSQGTAFTYQGRLADSGNAANGAYEIAFSLFSASSGGGPLTTPLTNSVPVSNGLFTVTLDFGANFPGADRWLEIAARTNGGAFVTLSPRQKIT